MNFAHEIPEQGTNTLLNNKQLRTKQKTEENRFWKPLNLTRTEQMRKLPKAATSSHDLEEPNGICFCFVLFNQMMETYTQLNQSQHN